MRKNLTISLAREDWILVQACAKSLGETYSGLFQKLIRRFLMTGEIRPRIVSKYQRLFKPHSDFLSSRAAAFAKARRATRSSA